MGGRHVRAIVFGVLAWAGAGCDDEQTPIEPELEGVDLQLMAQGLVSPVALAEQPNTGGGSWLYVLDQIGRIRVVTPGGQLQAEPFLDIASRMVPLGAGGDERGLLGLAFHPAYATNGRFYVYYSAPRRSAAPSNWNHTSHISEFVANSPTSANASSERIVLQVDQPQANHNGGDLAFGPDGMLYISLGDGGGANDQGVGHVPGGNGQDPSELLGSILRIDVNATPYRVPPTNPFAGRADGRGEIWAYGLRNPFRFSFDRTTGDLIAGDVGQNRWEEVNRIVRGGNYGWVIREGFECFQPASGCGNVGRLGEPLIDPVLAYPNRAQSGASAIAGVAVIGGYVYRGVAIPGLHGRYVFGDFSGAQGGLLLVATPVASGPWTFEPLELPDRAGGVLGHLLKGFGEGRDGAIYVLTTDQGGPTGTSGRVYRIVPSSP
jgi:glucose/arabinose dehydrogenase